MCFLGLGWGERRFVLVQTNFDSFQFDESKFALHLDFMKDTMMFTDTSVDVIPGTAQGYKMISVAKTLRCDEAALELHRLDIHVGALNKEFREVPVRVIVFHCQSADELVKSLNETMSDEGNVRPMEFLSFIPTLPPDCVVVHDTGINVQSPLSINIEDVKLKIKTLPHANTAGDVVLLLMERAPCVSVNVLLKPEGQNGWDMHTTGGLATVSSSFTQGRRLPGWKKSAKPSAAQEQHSAGSSKAKREKKKHEGKKGKQKKETNKRSSGSLLRLR